MTDHGQFVDTMKLIIDRLRYGDIEARDQLIGTAYEYLEERTQRMLCGFPRVRATDEAGDVLHGALLRLLRALDDVLPTSANEFLALAVGEIKRELVDRARLYSGPAWRFTHDTPRNKRQRLVVGATGGDDDSEDSVDREDWMAFQAAVEQLPTEERAVASLIFYHRWT
jgi:DNA-directed RNA polymerase specialized sigma24 family protein